MMVEKGGNRIRRRVMTRNCALHRLFAMTLLAFVELAGAADLPATFDPSRDAARDLAQALSLAASQGKRVIVDVGGEWCSWCHVLDRFIAANADVRSLIGHNYVWLKVNYSKENRNQALLARWPRVAGYPHLFVLAASGELVQSQDTGRLESGDGYDKERMLAFLRRWSAPVASGASATRT